MLLGATLVLVLSVGLFPFQLTSDSRHSLSVDLISAGETPSGAVRDVLANSLLFVPFGLSLSALVRRHRVSPCPRLLIVLAAGLVLSLTVEGMQTFLPSRDPTLRDVVANTAGALLGALPGARWERPASAMWGTIGRTGRRLWVIRRPGAALAIHLALSFLAAGLLQTRTDLSNWDLEFPLLIGNEATGDRPWSGRLLALEIADQALRPAQVDAAFSVGLGQLLDPVIASFHLSDGRSEGGPVGFVWNRAGPPSPAAIPGPGLWLSGTEWLGSTQAGRRINQALGRTNQLTLKLVCRSADPGQGGPARLVSISADPYHRNLMLGQEGSELVVRLRTPLTGLNGRNPEMVKPRVFDTAGFRTILVTYDGAVLTVFVDSARDATRFDLSPGAVLAGAFLPPSASDLAGYKFAFVALVAAPAGFLVALTLRRRCPVSIGLFLLLATFGILLAGTLEGILILVSGRLLDLSHVLTGALLCSGGSLCALYSE